MESTNQTEIQSGPVLPDGIGRFVRDTLSRSNDDFAGVLLTPATVLAAIAYIVRTVLNGGSLPDDVTCAFLAPNSSRVGLIHGIR